jgi:hypothetical protein
MRAMRRRLIELFGCVPIEDYFALKYELTQCQDARVNERSEFLANEINLTNKIKSLELAKAEIPPEEYQPIKMSQVPWTRRRRELESLDLELSRRYNEKAQGNQA